MLSNQYRSKLLGLARSVLENELIEARHDLNKFDDPLFAKKRGLFVTLYSHGTLRGCIGRIEAVDSIYRNVLDLSKSAAFKDPRFSPLQPSELDSVNIEISILSVPMEVTGDSSMEKVRKLRPFIDGVILSAEGMHSTFLPQVWDGLPDHHEFMAQLCLKAHLDADYWKHNEINIQSYQVEHFKEADN